MDTRQLIQATRAALLEWDQNPISDEHILMVLNQAYLLAYNHLVRSQDGMFGKYVYLQLVAGVTDYEIPRECYSKRIETVEYPTPPNAPVTWNRLRKVDAKQAYAYDLPRIATYLPNVFCQLNNKIRILPMPNSTYSIRILISRRLEPLALPVGRVMAYHGVNIVLDAFDNEEAIIQATNSEASYVNIVDFATGEVKKTFHYYLASGNTISLDNAPNERTTYRDTPLSPVYSVTASTLWYDTITKIVTGSIEGSIPTALEVGNYVEVSSLLDFQTQYITRTYAEQDRIAIEASIAAGDGYLLPDVQLSSVYTPDYNRLVMVTAVDRVNNKISWQDTGFVPFLYNGFRTNIAAADLLQKDVQIENHDVKTTIQLAGAIPVQYNGAVTLSDSTGHLSPITIAATTHSFPTQDLTLLETYTVLYKAYTTRPDAMPQAEANVSNRSYDTLTHSTGTVAITSYATPGCGNRIKYRTTPHGLGLSNATTRVTMTDGITDYGGGELEYMHAEITDAYTLSLPVYIGAKYTHAVAATLHYNFTGIPALSVFDATLGTVNSSNICKGTPRTFSLITVPNSNYDISNNPALDDFVCMAGTTCVPITGPAFDHFLIEYTALLIRSSMNETDEASNEALKLLLGNLKSDTAGRVMAIQQSRDFNGQKSYRAPTRWGRGR